MIEWDESLNYKDPVETLKEISTERLEMELFIRKQEEKKRQEAEKKIKEVIIICPKCNGAGKYEYSENGAYMGMTDCYQCEGKGKIKAYLA